MAAISPALAAHRLNRRAFGQIDVSSALLQLYCTLVAIELALKDDSGSMTGEHDVVKLAKNLGDRSIEVAADGLDRAAAALVHRQEEW